MKEYIVESAQLKRDPKFTCVKIYNMKGTTQERKILVKVELDKVFEK